jgi:FkbM family methyltransferase
MKILILTNLYPPQVVGGYERSIADFARLLKHGGHEVIVLTSDCPHLTSKISPSVYPEPVIDRRLQLGGQWQVERGAEWFSPEQIATADSNNEQILSDYLQSFQPDVCLAGNMDFLNIALLNQVLALSIPVAHYVMNSAPGYPPEETPASPLYRFVTCSDWVTGSLLEKGYPAQTAVTVYPGAAVQEFYQPELPVRDRLRIAYASLVMHYKGADVLVEALSLLHNAGIDFTATIAGGTLIPTFVEALEQFVESEGMADRVKFTGVLSRQELIDLYRTHNVLAFPSRFQEPFGISQVEAMAAGLTLVTSGTGGAREIVEHGQDGLLFESENPLDLADMLAYLPAHPEEWAAIAQRGQQKALTEFSQEKAAARLEAVFQEMLDLKAGRILPLSGKHYRIGRFDLVLPANHKLDQYQATWKRYDTALGYIADMVFQKYPQSCAIDIGANVGDTAALLRNHTDVPILCVEGSPEFLPFLEQNARAIQDLEIECCFVGKDGDSVNVDRIHSHSGTATVLAALSSDTGESVAMRSLAALLDKHPQYQQTKLLKVDTDGFDFAILNQSADLLQTLQPVVYFEYDTNVLPEGNTESLVAIQNLFEAGYCHFVVYDNFGNYVISLSGQERDRFVDLNICLASNRRISGTPAIYYYDVCAFTACDRDLFEQLRQFEMDLVKA